MSTIGLELCDAGFLTASATPEETALIDVPDARGATDWSGFSFQDGAKLVFGRGAEDMWFVHPRRVVHTFWSRLAHEPSPLHVGPKAASFSEVAYFFLREFMERLNATARPFEKLVIAVPGAYLKDATTEDEKIGLLLGMASELKLPLAGLIDMACAALCDPRAIGFNPALPVVVVDLHLEGADLTLFTAHARLERQDFIHLPQCGYAHLLKQLTSTMGNRFLRQTAFDILEDGRIEQTFFRQTKDFLLSGAPDHRYHINTAARSYEMTAKREQLGADANAFVVSLVQGLQSFLQNTPLGGETCTIALTDRTAHLPGLESRLRQAGFSRLIRLPRGAAAAGAARIGATRLAVPSDLADVPLETSAPLADIRRSVTAPWDVRLQKTRHSGKHLAPTHAVLDGLGHALGNRLRFTIGVGGISADLPLPEAFNSADCAVPLLNDGGRWWFVDPTAREHAASEAVTPRIAIDAGDRLTLRCGSAVADILFAYCPVAPGVRAS